MNDRLMGLWATKNKDDEWWSPFVTSPIAIAASYAAYMQSQSVLPVFLAFMGVAFYTLRGYS